MTMRKPPLLKKLQPSAIPQEESSDEKPKSRPLFKRSTIPSDLDEVIRQPDHTPDPDQPDFGLCPKCSKQSLVMMKDEKTLYCPVCGYDINVFEHQTPSMDVLHETQSERDFVRIPIVQRRALFQYLRMTMARQELIAVRSDLEPTDIVDEQLLEQAIKAVTLVINRLYDKLALDSARIPPQDRRVK